MAALQWFWAGMIGGFSGAITVDVIRRIRRRLARRARVRACSCQCVYCWNGHHAECPFECYQETRP